MARKTEGPVAEKAARVSDPLVVRLRAVKEHAAKRNAAVAARAKASVRIEQAQKDMLAVIEGAASPAEKALLKEIGGISSN